jgi:hypothetical protein
MSRAIPVHSFGSSTEELSLYKHYMTEHCWTSPKRSSFRQLSLGDIRQKPLVFPSLVPACSNSLQEIEMLRSSHEPIRAISKDEISMGDESSDSLMNHLPEDQCNEMQHCWEPEKSFRPRRYLPSASIHKKVPAVPTRSNSLPRRNIPKRIPMLPTKQKSGYSMPVLHEENSFSPATMRIKDKRALGIIVTSAMVSKGTVGDQERRGVICFAHSQQHVDRASGTA